MNLFAIGQTARFHSRVSRLPFTECGSLRLFVRGESFLDNCRDSLAVLAHRTVLPSSLCGISGLFATIDARPGRAPVLGATPRGKNLLSTPPAKSRKNAAPCSSGDRRPSWLGFYPLPNSGSGEHGYTSQYDDYLQADSSR